jgi:hypothetical protein
MAIHGRPTHKIGHFTGHWPQNSLKTCFVLRASLLDCTFILKLSPPLLKKANIRWFSGDQTIRSFVSQSA